MNDNEAKVQADIQIQAVSLGCHLMRNNSGAFQDNSGRLVRFGLGNVSKQHSERIKSSDLIGFTRVVITPEMVGHTVAIFTAFEIKAPSFKITASDKRARAQLAFIEWIGLSGGIAAMLTSVADLPKVLKWR